MVATSSVRVSPRRTRGSGSSRLVAGVAELAITQEQVRDRQQDDEAMAKDRGDVQVAEARAQPVLEAGGPEAGGM